MVRRQKEDLGICQTSWETGWEEVRENHVNTRDTGREGLGKGTDTMTASPVELAGPRGKSLYCKASLHPLGSFEVAFPDAAEKMRKVIIQLKEGKTDSISFPQAQTDTIRNPRS